MAVKTPKKIPLPKTLGACADRLYQVKNERLAITHDELDPRKAEESALKDHIIENLPKSQASGISGKCARVTVSTSKEPVVKDWPKFYAHIKKTGQWDLLSKAISKDAIKERWANKEQVPGVGVFNAVIVNLNKV